MTSPLYDPRSPDQRNSERDACGIGLVADARGRASRELLDRALAGLAAVSHRGAWAADGVTGDGAGVLVPLTPAITGIEGGGVAMCFLREPWLKNIVEEACRVEGLEPVGWREVPHDVAALGSTATASMPRIAQLVLAPCPAPDAELRAHRARRRAESVSGVYVASLSFRTVTYKALCAATQLASFYPDLADPNWEAAWAIFHQRFSTNTEPSWERAQPFRLLCHNGEINTIDGNAAWMEARERARGGHEGLAAAIDRTGSDSAVLDNALELLVRSGLDVREAMTHARATRLAERPPNERRGAGDASVPRDARGALGWACRPRVHRRHHLRCGPRPERAAAAAHRRVRRRVGHRRLGGRRDSPLGGCRGTPRATRPGADSLDRPRARPALRR